MPNVATRQYLWKMYLTYILSKNTSKAFLTFEYLQPPFSLMNEKYTIFDT